MEILLLIFGCVIIALFIIILTFVIYDTFVLPILRDHRKYKKSLGSTKPSWFKRKFHKCKGGYEEAECEWRTEQGARFGTPCDGIMQLITCDVCGREKATFYNAYTINSNVPLPIAKNLIAKANKVKDGITK